MVTNAGHAHPGIVSLPKTADAVLYDGPAMEGSAGEQCQLRVVARWSPKQDVHWTADFHRPRLVLGEHLTFRLMAPGPYRDQLVTGHMTRSGSNRLTGWIDGGRFLGRTTEAVPSVFVRWVNLGKLEGDEWVQASAPDGTLQRWTGRQSWLVGGWVMTVDSRPDSTLVTDLKDTGEYAVTHLAELRRSDRQFFTAGECQPVLDAFQLAASFILGRFTSPVLAEGYDERGQLAWREWTSRFVAPLGGVTTWWHRAGSPIAEPVRLLGDVLLDPRRAQVAGHVIQAYVSSNRGGFVEHRIMIAFSALELLSWQRNVLEGGENPAKHEGKKAAQRLRSLLTDANISLAIPHQLVALTLFARDEGIGDGPNAAAEVRHRLTHPKSPNDIYNREGLLVDAWLLTVKYLELLTLHWIGYRDGIVDRTIRNDWIKAKPVPWACC